MCDVCEARGLDWQFSNAGKDKLEKAKLFQVYKQKISVVKLCYIHSVELFRLGEKRFLQHEVELCRMMTSNRNRFAKDA